MGFLVPAVTHGAPVTAFREGLHPTIQWWTFAASTDASGHGMTSGNRDAAPGNALKIIPGKEVMTRWKTCP